MISIRPGKFGDLQLFQIKIDGEDVSAAVQQVNVYMDIFSPCWSAVVFMSDTSNTLMVLPIKPGSKVTVKIKTEGISDVTDGEKEFEFMVYRIGDKQFQNQQYQTYTLFCAHKSFLLNTTKRVSKCYSDKKPEEAMKSLFGEYLGLGEVTSGNCQSEVQYHVIIPNWSPFVAAAWLCKLAIRQGAADYVFFQTDNEKWSMKSIEYIYTDKQEEVKNVTLAQLPTDVRNDDGDFTEDFTLSITNYTFEHYDALGNLSAGYYKNKILTYDVINKKFESKTFTFGEDIGADKEKKPWDNEIFENAEDSNITFLPKHPGLHEKPTIDDNCTTWSPSRKTNIIKLNQDRLIVQMPGGVAMWEWIGKTIKVNLPAHQVVEPDETYDKQFKGKYIVGSMCLSIGKDAFMVNIELIKKRHEIKLGS